MKQSPSGFTLIELLASAVLAAMMTAGLFQVVWSTTRQTVQLRKSEAVRQPTTQLVEQMRQDFQNARGMLVTPAGVVLHGFVDRDPSSRCSTLRVGTARYEKVHRGNRGLLVRTVTGGGETFREPVWFGFGSLRVEALETTETEDALLSDPASGGLPRVPGRFRVTMIGDNGERLWREVIHHHAR